MSTPTSTTPTTRFSDRVDDYARYRPGYPSALIDTLVTRCDLRTDSIVADIGAGTGIFTRLLLEHGCRVHAVEPNDAMRAVAERDLADNSRFSAYSGTAEATGLAESSVDLVTVAQAFHWFDPEATRRELSRILRRPAWVAIVWHRRLTSVSPFARAYERLLQKHSTDYAKVDHRRIDRPALERFFGHSAVRLDRFDYLQALDWQAFRGRVLSSSYTPAAGAPAHEPFVEKLATLFDRHQVDDKVVIVYQTQLWTATL